MIIVDTREQQNQFILDYLEERNIPYKIQKLDVGDYAFEENQKFVIDRKASINELIQNVVHEHKRIMNEIRRAKDNGVEIMFLVEEDEVQTLDDLQWWRNPRLQWSPKATKGPTFLKMLNTIIERYGIQVIFINKQFYAMTLVRLLEVHKDG